MADIVWSERAEQRYTEDLRATGTSTTPNHGTIVVEHVSMFEIKYAGDVLWQRIERAVEVVKDRLRRVTRALNSAEVPYAVIGGNAVQHWVAQVDESVV